MKAFFGLLLCFPFIIWAIIRIYAGIEFNINCGGHMERAATANTIALAQTEMQTVISYAKDHNMTSGYTSVFYNTPDEDIGFWYTNMQASLNELDNMKPTATELEKSNTLIKLRESVVQSTKDGTEIIVPTGISVYPHNLGLAWLLIVSLPLKFIGCVMIALLIRES